MQRTSRLRPARAETGCRTAHSGAVQGSEARPNMRRRRIAGQRRARGSSGKAAARRDRALPALRYGRNGQGGWHGRPWCDHGACRNDMPESVRDERCSSNLRREATAAAPAEGRAHVRRPRLRRGRGCARDRRTSERNAADLQRRHLERRRFAATGGAARLDRRRRRGAICAPGRLGVRGGASAFSRAC